MDQSVKRGMTKGAGAKSKEPLAAKHAKKFWHEYFTLTPEDRKVYKDTFANIRDGMKKRKAAKKMAAVKTLVSK